MYRASNYILILFFIAWACKESEETKSPLDFFHSFLEVKNKGKFSEMKDKLDMDKEKNKIFFNQWQKFYNDNAYRNIIKIKTSSCNIYSFTNNKQPEIIFQEGFLTDTCKVRLLPKGRDWQIEILTYNISSSF